MYVTVRAADLRYLMDTYVDYGRTPYNAKRGDVVYERLWQALEDSGINPYVYDETLYPDNEVNETATCIFTGVDGENADDCTTHRHEGDLDYGL